MRRILPSIGLGLLVACSEGGAEGGGSTSGTTSASSTGTTGAPTSSTDAGSSSSSSSTSTSSTGATSTGPMGTPTVLFPRTSILPEELGVIVNDDDPLSLAVAEDYIEARGIPDANVVHLSFATQAVMPSADFGPLWDTANAELDDTIQGLVLTFTQPYRVDCMSITSAFALGFDLQWCNTTGGPCGETAASGFYDSASLAPFADHGIRPTMMLAAQALEDAQAVIDRGVASDGSHPVSEGYMIRTTDNARSVRFFDFIETQEAWADEDGLSVSYIDNNDGQGSNVLSGEDPVLFYFTGLTQVTDIDTNTYVPGAVADHLTSFGGQVPDSSQMSILRWLEAGATASYGTVVEPCNGLAKFPDTRVLLPHYFRGQTVLEAYWKSVRTPGEGLFIGEPLARPWDGSTVEFIDGDLHITTTLLAPGVVYDIEGADGPDGPWTLETSGSVPAVQTLTIVIENATWPYYRVVPS